MFIAKKIPQPYNGLMLSIVVLFCEKDMWHIPELVRHTKETFKGEYELVLVDNRKDKSAPPPDVGWPIHEASGDGTFEGRRFSLTKCRGKYVWFVDADDITLDWSGFVDLDSQDADFLFFNAAELRDERFGPMYSGDIPTFLMQQGDVLHEDIRLEVNLDSFLHVYLPLWNKFIRLDFARRVYDMVPPLPSVTDHEDSLMSAMLLTNGNRYLESPFYGYTNVNALVHLTEPPFDASFLRCYDIATVVANKKDLPELIKAVSDGKIGRNCYLPTYIGNDKTLALSDEDAHELNAALAEKGIYRPDPKPGNLAACVRKKEVFRQVNLWDLTVYPCCGFMEPPIPLDEWNLQEPTGRFCKGCPKLVYD